MAPAAERRLVQELALVQPPVQELVSVQQRAQELVSVQRRAQELVSVQRRAQELRRAVAPKVAPCLSIERVR